LVRDRPPVLITDGDDLQLARVEIERPAARRAQSEQRLGIERAGVEVHARVPLERVHLGLYVVVVRVRVESGHGPSSDGAGRERDCTRSREPLWNVLYGRPEEGVHGTR